MIAAVSSTGQAPGQQPRHRAVIALRRPGEHSVVRIEHVEPGQCVRLEGRVDVHTVADLRTALREAIDHGVGELVVDCAGVELGDTTGLGALLGAHRRAIRSGRALVLADVPPSLARLLAATRLARIFRTREAAGLDVIASAALEPA